MSPAQSSGGTVLPIGADRSIMLGARCRPWQTFFKVDGDEPKRVGMRGQPSFRPAWSWMDRLCDCLCRCWDCCWSHCCCCWPFVPLRRLLGLDMCLALGGARGGRSVCRPPCCSRSCCGPLQQGNLPTPSKGPGSLAGQPSATCSSCEWQ